MNWDVFRAYDIRGIYPDDIDEEAYYRIAKAYVYLFKPKTMVVGMDARLSSPPLKAGLIKGFLDAGVDVVDIGRSPPTCCISPSAPMTTRAASSSLRRTIQRIQRHENGARESHGDLFRHRIVRHPRRIQSRERR